MVNEVPLVMPKMSMTMTEGTFLMWHKAPGDQIREGDVVCEVATDKVDMEVEATIAGTLTRLLAEPEDVVEVGQPLAYIATEAEELLGGLFDPPPLKDEDSADEPNAKTANPNTKVTKSLGEVAEPSSEEAAPPSQVAEGSPQVAEPSAQAAEPVAEMAEPNTKVGGSNTDVTVSSADVVEPVAETGEVLLGGLRDSLPSESAPEGRAESPPPTPAVFEALTAVSMSAASRMVPAAVPAARRLAAERGIDLATVTATGPWGTIRLSDVDSVPNRRRPVSRGRAAVARRMAASAQVPQFVLYRDLDLEAVERTHSWTVLLTHAFAAALRRHPEINASWIDGTVQRHGHVGVALAVDTPRGLLAPVLTDPDRSDLDTLATRISDVVARARAGRLGLAELSTPATTTVSNLGGFGVTGFQALLTPPQATALAIGAIEPKVVPLPGGLGVRLRCTVGLSVDHRVADGADGARLLATLQELL